jgi:predicted nucleotidyltransferase
MQQRELIRRAGDVLEKDARVLAAWLAGSFGRGDADAFSDVDLLVVVGDDERPGFLDEWESIVERIAPTVYRNALVHGAIGVYNAITEDWLRFDLMVVGPEHVRARPRSGLELLFDRARLHDGLPERGAPIPPNPDAVRRLTLEFLRVLGLLPVALGRGEFQLAVAGCGLLRSHLVSLFLETAGVEDRGGALKLNPLLSAEQRALLEGLPPVAATRESVIDANRAMADAFLPCARALHEELGLDWPEEFERATLSHLENQVGLRLGEHA